MSSHSDFLLGLRGSQLNACFGARLISMGRDECKFSIYSKSDFGEHVFEHLLIVAVLNFLQNRWNLSEFSEYVSSWRLTHGISIRYFRELSMIFL